MAKTIVVIASTLLFSLLGLAAGSIVIYYMPPGTTTDGNVPRYLLVPIMVFGPTLAGAVVGLVVGCVAVFIAKRADDTEQ